MKALFNIGMFFASPLLIYIMHMYSIRRIVEGGGVQQSQEMFDFYIISAFH